MKSTNSTNGKKDLHSGAACKFCKQKWSCGKISKMIAHLALQCSIPPPPEVRALYLEILNNGSFDDNDNNNPSKRSKSYKQSKITNHVERLTVTDDKQRRCSRALTKFFVTCFQVPKRIILSTTIINVETATVITEMKKKLSNETNLTLDGWTSPADQSLYIFLIMTSDGKEYIHSLKNFSKNSHTGEFLKNEIIKVIEEAIINLEHKSTTLVDCFINLVIMAIAIKELSQTRGREKSANELIAQILNYFLKSKPYDFEFVIGIHTVKNWWLMCKQQNNHIQKLALLMASIVPSNASCERYFSVLGCLNCSLLQNMLQMHAYYVSNISNEIKHAYKELNNEEFEDAVTKTTFPFDDKIFDENNDELENNQFENDNELENNQFENNEGENQISNSQNFDSFFNVIDIRIVTDIELRRVFEIEVTVEISLSTEYTDSGEQNFNIESIINKLLERRKSGINNITE
ncbi:hypothetical protein Glove_95g85 [Diversispora epigaea]|uniref:HAT C-terminal dimerisation domain-containing protein n=1 Tax=Diversispora epigaea TaxID=1348612 RepID=A0A397J518_9GLOM|nr:hypothetical protein Glove_95g85 [Diversispora epigaea]